MLAYIFATAVLVYSASCTGKTLRSTDVDGDKIVVHDDAHSILAAGAAC